MTDAGKRIEQVIKYFGLNKNSFSKEIGMSNNVTIGRILNEERNPSNETLLKITNRYPQIDYDWLKSGIGNMLKYKTMEIIKLNEYSEVHFDFKSIDPLYDENIDNSGLEILRSEIERLKIFIEKQGAVIVQQSETLKDQSEVIKKQNNTIDVHKATINEQQATINRQIEAIYKQGRAITDLAKKKDTAETA